MTTEEYAAAMAVITAAAANYALKFVSFFTKPALSVAEWVAFLQVLFPAVERYRRDAADLSRRFYDSQRQIHYPDLPRNDVFLEPYQFDWFVTNMEPVREKLMRQDSPASTAAEFSLQFVREVEIAGRQQIIHAVENDVVVERIVELQQKRVERKKADVIQFPQQEPPVSSGISDQLKGSDFVRPGENRPVKGWARIATGRETCAWCLVLVSRGPVYKTAETAGAKVDNPTAVDALLMDADVSEWMNQWHTGCDCKVVPVYNLNNWPGMDAQERALQLYVDAHEDARAWMEKYPDRVKTAGEHKGESYTWNEEVILALRRRIDRGEIKPTEWAVLQAA